MLNCSIDGNPFSFHPQARHLVLCAVAVPDCYGQLFCQLRAVRDVWHACPIITSLIRRAQGNAAPFDSLRVIFAYTQKSQHCRVDPTPELTCVRSVRGKYRASGACIILRQSPDGQFPVSLMLAETLHIFFL